MFAIYDCLQIQNNANVVNKIQLVKYVSDYFAFFIHCLWSS